MIKALINGIFSLVLGLVSIILAPIDLVIQNALPGLSEAFTSIGNLFNLIGNVMGWGISVFGLSNTAINILTLYYTFVLTVPLSIWMIKLALSWYDKLKP